LTILSLKNSFFPHLLVAFVMELGKDIANAIQTDQIENLVGDSFDNHDLERRRSLPASFKVCESQESLSAAASVSMTFTQPWSRGHGTAGGPPPRKFEKSYSQHKFIRTYSVPTISNAATFLSGDTTERKEVCQNHDLDRIHKPYTHTHHQTG
jgi:hypothetical protein